MSPVRSSLARSVATVGGLTLASRLAGFARDVLTAAALGAGPVADAFFVALKLPNLFRRMFAEGALSVAFVPLFARTVSLEGHDAAIRFAGEALAALLALLLPLTALAILAMPWLMHALAPGFLEDGERFALAVSLGRLTFPYLMLVAVVALLGGVLNALDRFGPFAAAPIAFNLTLIAALLAAPRLGWEPGTAMAAAVGVSGVVQVVWMAWACRAAGITIPLLRPRLTPAVRRLARLVGPGALGAGVVQVNLFIGVVIASFLPAGAVSALYYADRLNQLPLGVIGIAIGTALLPPLARAAAADDTGRLRNGLSRAVEYGLLLGLPAAVALAVAGRPIVSVLFERGAFGPDETRATAAALAAYAVGLPAFVIAKALSAAFFARQDMATPVRVTILVTVANTALALALLPLLAETGIALAAGLTAWLDLGLLAWALRRRGHLSLDAQVCRRAPRIALASGAMGGGLSLAASALAPWLASPTLGLPALAMLVGGGLLLFTLAAHGLGAADIREIKSFRRPPRHEAS